MLFSVSSPSPIVTRSKASYPSPIQLFVSSSRKISSKFCSLITRSVRSAPKNYSAIIIEVNALFNALEFHSKFSLEKVPICHQIVEIMFASMFRLPDSPMIDIGKFQALVKTGLELSVL